MVLSSGQSTLRSPIQRRMFIVGCPRSGTTLLQSLLAAHSQIHSFPESQFFPFLFSNDQAENFLNSELEQPWMAPMLKLAARKLVFGSARSRLQTRIQEFLADIDQVQYYSRFPHAAIGTKIAYTQAFWQVLDMATQAQAKTIWIEKSPLHLYYLDYITQQVPQALFIHILRSGPDTIASLYDVRQHYADHWQRTAASAEGCTTEWLRAVRISQRYRDRPHHIVLCYEQLVTQPEAVIAQLCAAIGITYEPTMLDRYQQVAQNVSLASEPWKQNVQQPIANQNSTKFAALFDAAQQAEILTRIAPYDLAAIATLGQPSPHPDLSRT